MYPYQSMLMLFRGANQDNSIVPSAIAIRFFHFSSIRIFQFTKLLIVQELQQSQEAEQKMFGKSDSIKSKKEKIRNKKQQKFGYSSKSYEKRKGHQIQIIVDSFSSQSSSSSVKILSHKKKKAQKHQSSLSGRDQSLKYNNFNYERMRRSSGPLIPPPRPALLEIQQCLQGIAEKPIEENRPISYKRSGTTFQNTISQTHLKIRLQNITKEPAKPIPQAQQIAQQKPQQEVEKAQCIKRIQRNVRYFDNFVESQSDNSQSEKQQEEYMTKKFLKCFRCGQKGHIARMCNQKEQIRCMYCLGPHYNTQCTDKLCFRCNQKGHMKQQCKSDKVQCRKCRNYGHKAKNCGKILMMNFRSEREKEIQEDYQKSDLQKLKCLKCNGYQQCKGHFNCHQYPKKIPKIYGRSDKL